MVDLTLAIIAAAMWFGSPWLSTETLDYGYEGEAYIYG